MRRRGPGVLALQHLTPCPCGVCYNTEQDRKIAVTQTAAVWSLLSLLSPADITAHNRRREELKVLFGSKDTTTMAQRHEQQQQQSLTHSRHTGRPRRMSCQQAALLAFCTTCGTAAAFTVTPQQLGRTGRAVVGQQRAWCSMSSVPLAAGSYSSENGIIRGGRSSARGGSGRRGGGVARRVATIDSTDRVAAASPTGPSAASAAAAGDRGGDALSSIRSLVQQYGVQLPDDGDIPYQDSQGQYYFLSAEEEACALQAVATATELLRTQHQLVKASANNKAPTLAAWGRAAGLTPTALQAALAAGLAAKRLLVATNMPLVYSIVNKHFRRRLERENLAMTANDLVQEGVLGLARAVELYDGSRSAGGRFQTYAWYWIKASIDAGILSGGHAVKLPRRAKAAYDGAMRELSTQLNRAPTETELARHMGLTVEQLTSRYALANRTSVMSLDTRFADGHDMGDLILEGHQSPEALAAAGAEEGSHSGTDLRAAMAAALTPQERSLVTMRFGLDDGRQRTLKECAQATLLSADATKRMLDSSLAKVRAHILSQESVGVNGISGSSGGGDFDTL